MIANTHKIKILHLEDLRSDAELVENQLRKDGLLFEKLVVDTKIDFEKALKEFLPDIILSDHALLNFDSVGALKIVKNAGVLIPFILVTSTVSEEFAVEIMKQGAYDYILKDRMQRLPGAMLGALEKYRLEREEKEANEKINKANRLYSFISQVNQNIVHLKDKGALFHNSCRLAHDFGKFKMAWIGMFDSEHTHISLIEQRGVPGEITGRFTNALCQKDGPQHYVLRTGTYYICNDVRNSQELKSWRSFAVSYNINSCMVLPIKKSGNIIGTLNLYSTELNFSEQEEITLLAEVAADISFALDSFEKEKQHRIAEDLIVKSEKRYRQTLDSMLEGIQMHDFNWKYIYVNDALVKHSTYLKDELLGHTLLEKYPGIEQTGLFAVLQKCMNERTTSQFETEFVFPNGTKAFFELSVQPIPEGIFILSIDITERKKSREKTEADEIKYRSVVENIHESLIIEDAEGNLIHANAEFCKMFGFEPGEVEKLTVKDYTSAGSYPEVIARHNNRVKGMPVDEEFIYKGLRKDGTEIWVEARVSSIIENGKITGTQSLERDITGRRQAEEKIVKTSRLYAFISAINKSIVHVKDEHELLTNTCNIAVGIGQFKMAWIDFIDEQSGTLKTVGLCGAKTIIEAAKKLSGIRYDDPVLSGTLTGIALSTGKLAVSNNLQADALASPWKTELVEHGIKSQMVLPIKKFGETVGVFRFYSVVESFFDEEEIALLEEAIGDISFALENFEKEKKHSETEKLVLKNEKRFRALIEKSADMKTLTNLAGKFIYGSPSVTKVFGYSLKEFLNKSAFTFFHPDDLPDLLKNRAIIQDVPGKSFFFQSRLLHKNGSWIWCEGTLTNMLHEPAIGAFVSNFMDVSEKKLAEQEKEFDKNNLNALINNTADLMWSVDRDFNLITSNKPFDEMAKANFGHVVEKGKSVLSTVYSPEMRNHFKLLYERAFAGETFTTTEYFNLPFEFWSEFFYCPIHKGDEVIGAACHSRDITERKKAERTLKQNETSLKEAQAIAHLGSWRLDFGTNVVSWSEEACRIYGIPSEENEHTMDTWKSFVHPGDLDYVMAETTEAQTTLSDTVLNYRIILKSGAIKYIYSKSKFEFDQNGKPAGLYGIVHDVTEIKEAERQLIKSEAFNRGVLNSLQSHIAVIDGSGAIVAVNESWKNFALENGGSTLQRTGVGSNYYEACEASAKAGSETALEALEGIKDVMDGKIPVFYLEYPCHSPSRQYWFALRAMKFDSDERLVVMAHMDISELKITQEELTNTLFELEDRVEIRTKELVDKNKSILDSINYAKRIQVGLLCRPTQLTEIFPKSFILFRPLDIVSGDFFWCYQKRNKKFIVLADCTGHGVPGALMSIIGNNLLTHIIIDEHIENPSEILELLDTRLADAVKGDTQEVKDGMDITLCVVDTHFNELYFAGAYNPLFISNENGEIYELAANRHAIGGGTQETGKKFETKRFPIIPGQRIYLSSDGYYSQFGGPKGKKFMKSQFKKTLEEIQNKQIDQQNNLLTDALTEWTGNNEQVDDIMVIGIEL